MLEEIFPADDEAAMVAAVSDDFISHEASPGTPSGPSGVLHFMHLLSSAFSDQKWTIHRVIAGDTAVVHCTHSGRHIGEFCGSPATGRSSAYQRTHMIRVVNGKKPNTGPSAPMHR